MRKVSFSKLFSNSLILGLSIFTLSFLNSKVWAQHTESNSIKGKVYLAQDSTALAGAQVMVQPDGGSTMTDPDGFFEIPAKALESAKQLVFSYPGLQKDTLSIENVNSSGDLSVFLSNAENKLKTVEIQGRINPTEMDRMQTGNMMKMGQGELLKAACCNLSESFETMPSVDVGFTDAVSGYKQVKLLGLAGPNTAFTREAIPDIRGLGAIAGLTFTPGVWVESMQLSKGVGSVVNGFEGVAGQINVEWWKPFMLKESPRLYLNAYQSVQGRSEGNVIFNHAFNDEISTSLLLHASSNWRKNDMNHDGFLDNPLGTNLIGSNRWFWYTKSDWEFQAGVKGVYVNHTGGQTDYSSKETADSTKPWGYHQDLNRIEGWAKLGKVYRSQPWKSMGLQLSAGYHDQNSQYGLRDYVGKETSIYANYIYQSIISNTNNVIKGGASFQYDHYNENFVGTPYNFKESVPGAFVEYSFNRLDKFGLVAGLRGDYHNLYGFFLTPRIHLRYAPTSHTVLRASAGRAQRTMHIFSENIGYLATNRNFLLEGTDPKGAYGLKPEVAWNMGVSLLQDFRLNYRDGSILVDYFYTNFRDQVVVDIENPREVRFYNLDGKSFAHSFQAQVDYEPVRMWDVRIAYRYFLVKTTYDGVLKEQPLMGTHRAFLNTGYQTTNHWKADFTFNWNGPKRLPTYILNGTEVAGHYSPSFIQMNLQISKSWKDKNVEVYAGGENLTNYMQSDLILNAGQPYREGFDASLIWGPGMGRNFYTGIRWKIN